MRESVSRRVLRDFIQNGHAMGQHYQKNTPQGLKLRGSAESGRDGPP